MVDAAVTGYWNQHYVRNGLCCLCGNRGVLDTRGVCSCAGVECGAVVFCICPNGQAMRSLKEDGK